MCTARSHAAERKEPSRWERSNIRYTQQRDTRDTTSDREGWKVTDGQGRDERERSRAGGLGGEAKKWSSRVWKSRRWRGWGRQTIRDTGNRQSSRTILTGHKYKKAGKVNRRRLRQKCSTGERGSFHHLRRRTAPLSVSRGEWSTLDTHEMSYVCVCVLQTTLTCMVDETLDSERPSRSDNRLGEITEDFWVFVGAGQTERCKSSRDWKERDKGQDGTIN